MTRVDGQDLDRIVLLSGPELETRLETLRRRGRHEGRRARDAGRPLRVSSIAAAAVPPADVGDDLGPENLCSVDVDEPSVTEAAGNLGHPGPEFPRRPGSSVGLPSDDVDGGDAVSARKIRRLDAVVAEGLGTCSEPSPHPSAPPAADGVGPAAPEADLQSSPGRRRATAPPSPGALPNARLFGFSPEQLAMAVATVEAAYPGVDITRTARRVAGLLGVAVDLSAYSYIFDVLRAVRHLDALSAEAADVRARLLCQLEPSGMAALTYCLADFQARMRRRADDVSEDFGRDLGQLSLPAPGPDRPDLDDLVYISD